MKKPMSERTQEASVVLVTMLWIICFALYICWLSKAAEKEQAANQKVCGS